MTEQQLLAGILLLSTLAQLAAAIAAIRLIVVTGRALAWMLISFALFCMVFRRAIPLCLLLQGRTTGTGLAEELLGLLLSSVMLAGILLIGKLFRSIQHAREQEELATRRLQEASVAGKVALWEWDIAGGTIEWSTLVDDMLGFPPNGFPRTYRAWETRIHMDDLNGVQQAMRRNFEANAPFDVTYRIQRADGTYVWWHQVGHVTRDRNGSPVAMAGSCVDITERKEREAEYTTMLQTAMDGFLLASARTGRLLDVNDAYCRLVGYTRAELLSMRIADLDLNETPSTLASHLQRVVRAGQDRFETRHRCKDGRALDLAASVQYLSHVNRICVFVNDITERKRNEADLCARLAEIERFNQLSTAREQRMIELKQQINRLAQAAGDPPPYAGSPDDPDAVQPEALTLPAAAPTPAAAPQVRADAALDELLDRRQLQVLLEHFSSAIGVSSAIVDPRGNVFVGANWQPICTAFHRIHERAWTRCVESDTVLAAQLEEGKAYTVFTCLNGMTMAAAPIVVEGRTLGSLFLSQFLLEPPDLAHFRHQAREFGFEEEAYLAALARVPVVPRAKLQPLLGFLASSAGLLAHIAQEHLHGQRTADEARRASAELHRQREAALNLAQDAIEARRSLEASEEALRLSRDMLAHILDTIPQAVLWKDRHSVYRGCNRVFAQAVCLASPDDVVGKTTFELFPNRERAERYMADDREVMDHNRPKRNIVEQVVRANGRPFWTDTTKLPLADRDGKVYGVLGVFEDITERKQAEQQLREQDARHRFALDTVGAGEWDLDLATLEARRSEQHGRIFGYEPPLPPWTLATLLQHVVAEDRERVEQSVRESVRLGQDVDFECRITRRDGERRWIWSRGRHVCDEHARPVRIAGIVMDITERKQSETWLRQSEERLQFAVTATQDAIWDWQPAVHRLYWSPRILDMLGYAPDEIEPSIANWETLLHPEDLPAARETLQQCIDGRRDDYHVEARFRTRDGRTRWVLIRGRVLARGLHGEILRMAGTHTDISERKQTEKLLQQQLQELRRWQTVMLGREQRTMELKREVNALHMRLGLPVRYPSAQEAKAPEPAD